MMGGDLGPAIALYDRVVAAYPQSPFAALALVDGGVLEEKQGRLREALGRYRRVLAQYPKDENSAPIALYRAAMVQEATGDWPSAKQALESLPPRFPGSRAAAEAPYAIVAHYRRTRDVESQGAALSRAVATYRKMIADDSTAAVTVLLRWNIVRAQIAGQNWKGALAAIDEMATKDRGEPLAAQALLEGARVARATGDRRRSEGYLRRLETEYPNLKVVTR
jgi:tetratricopeptide (TPR) repeat protein